MPLAKECGEGGEGELGREGGKCSEGELYEVGSGERAKTETRGPGGQISTQRCWSKACSMEWGFVFSDSGQSWRGKGEPGGAR